jgi:hypothetical protein
MGRALADYLGTPARLEFTGWHEAIDALLALGDDRPVPVVIDEFPYLVSANASLPSIIQNALAPRRPERERSRTRLLLCGSAMSFMGKLLGGTAPPRGRAGLELIVHPLDYALSTEFWGVSDPVLAVKVNAIVGGTPAYRREFVGDDTPAGPEAASPRISHASQVTSPIRSTCFRIAAWWSGNPVSKVNHELDVVAFGFVDQGPQPLLAIGEAKWNEVMGIKHLERLRRIRGLLIAQGRPDAATARLFCFGGSGFTDELRAEADRTGDVVLVNSADLYPIR